MAGIALTKTTWKVVRKDLFDESLERLTITFKDLPERIEKFIALKQSDPLNSRYGKHDGPMTGDLMGFHHCHLRDDAILIYRLKDRAINLVYVAAHAEIEGKRLKSMKKRLAGYL